MTVNAKRPRRPARLALALWVGAVAGSPAAQDENVTAPPPAPVRTNSLPAPDASARTNGAIRSVGPGVFELGKVRFDQKARSVTFPAVVNLRGGPVEYFLVTSYGKTHESIFRTDAEPYHIHLAMLLLDARGAGTNTPPPIDGPIEQPGLPPIQGDPVTLEVSWAAEGKSIRHAADELVFNQAERAGMTGGAWVYNGSVMLDGRFAAQLDGSIISLITDPGALVNNPRPGHENDEIWTTQTNRLPDVDTPVNITLRLDPGRRHAPAGRGRETGESH